MLVRRKELVWANTTGMYRPAIVREKEDDRPVRQVQLFQLLHHPADALVYTLDYSCHDGVVLLAPRVTATVKALLQRFFVSPWPVHTKLEARIFVDFAPVGSRRS